MSIDDKKTATEDLAEARGISSRLSASLPDKVDPAAIGVKSKAPFQLLTVREALMWRTEELSRNACDALERKDYTVAAMLIRGIAESTAMTWGLLETLEKRENHTPQTLNDKLMRMLAGSNKVPDGPKPIHINNFLERIEKTFPGFGAAYGALSEYVHPNWRGVTGLYSKFDEKNYLAYFGRELREGGTPGELAHMLVSGLITFEYAYNKIAELMPAWIAELESLWPDTEAGSATGST